MVLHKHLYKADTIFTTISGKLVNNPLVKCPGGFRRWAYQVAFQDIRWEYESVSDLCSDVDTSSNSRDSGSSDEGINDQDKPDN